jgi:hypothetical protein
MKLRNGESAGERMRRATKLTLYKIPWFHGHARMGMSRKQIAGGVHDDPRDG